jgi:2-haloacid dehalogenase
MLERGEIEKSKLYASRWVKLVEFYGFDADPYAMSDFYTETLATKSYLMDGALDICKYLYGKYHLYVVTNGKKSVQDGRFDPSPLAPMFEGVFVSEEIGFEKPRREFFDAVSAGIEGFDPRDAIIIGDSLTSDMQGGINYGIDTCWFNLLGKQAPEDMNITFVINSLDELKNIL